MLRLLSADEASAQLGACPETLRRLYRAGRIPAYRVGRHLKFDLDELREAFRDDRRQPTARITSTRPDFDAIETPR